MKDLQEILMSLIASINLMGTVYWNIVLFNGYNRLNYFRIFIVLIVSILQLTNFIYILTLLFKK